MKRFMIALTVLGLIVGSVATADAKGKKSAAGRFERTVEGTYGPYPSWVTGCNEVLGKYYCLAVKTRPEESFFTAKVTDTHGQPVIVGVYLGGNRTASFCGETTEPIRFTPGAELQFYVAEPPWPTNALELRCPTNRVKTTGTISVRLFNQEPTER